MHLRLLLTLFTTTSILLASDPSRLEHNFVQNPYQSDHYIEYFLKKPAEEGPYPVIFLLHGHNDEGAACFVNKCLDIFTHEKILPIAISMPGYGRSDGTRDFAGPDTQKAIVAVIDHFSRCDFVDETRMGVYGISKGAILASLLQCYSPPLKLQILESGCYDLTERLNQLPSYLDGILENMLRVTGGKKQDLLERSALYRTQYISSKTLILQGEFDDRKGLPSAKALHEKLLAEGKESLLRIFPTAHRIGPAKWEVIRPYLRNHFFEKYGIGIDIDNIPPALQVRKIIPNSPAAESERLQLGDAILAISPHNDHEEIDVLNMPRNQFIQLVLGAKGTLLRLRVQHLDLSCEEIILMRR